MRCSMLQCVAVCGSADYAIAAIVPIDDLFNMYMYTYIYTYIHIYVYMMYNFRTCSNPWSLVTGK